VFSSQIVTNRSKALPLTWLVGLNVLAVAAAAATAAVPVAVKISICGAGAAAATLSRVARAAQAMLSGGIMLKYGSSAKYNGRICLLLLWSIVPQSADRALAAGSPSLYDWCHGRATKAVDRLKLTD
jgi:hypothetical protein